LGYLMHAKCVAAYLRLMCDDYIHIWPHEPPDYYSAPVLAEYDHMASTYGEMAKLNLSDTLGHKGRLATLAPYMDDNLFHDWNTSFFVTGTLHSINVTPSDWYSKCQSMVETSYGSETMTVSTCVQQVIDLHSCVASLFTQGLLDHMIFPGECSLANILL